MVLICILPVLVSVFDPRSTAPANVALKSSLNVSAVAWEFKEEPLPEAFAV